jgi:XTP/dITP diphosphohydrolase
MLTLLVATSNPAKVREILEMLRDLPLNVRTLSDFPGVKVPDETGTTFEENARQKALHYARATGVLTMAEDSGFEVDALRREPGIHSARYLRADATYPERFEALYSKLKKQKIDSSAARFVCALAVASDSTIVFETKGTVEGQVAKRPAGGAGFGYDPIFYYPPYGKTFAEVSQKEKAAVSHRGKAIRALRTYLTDNRSLVPGP